MADEKMTGDAAAIIEAIKELYGTSTVESRLGETDLRLAAMPRGMQAIDLTPFFEELRINPRRRKGTVETNDLASFVLATNQFKDEGSCLFASREPAPTLIAVINYHLSGPETVPGIGTESTVARHCDHKIRYRFPVSDEWKAWGDLAARAFSQRDFAELLEDRIRDVLPQPTSEDLTDERFPGLVDLAGAIGGTWAGPSKLMELSRGLSVHVQSKVKDARNLSSGEAQIQFETEHRDASGELLRVPSLVLIGIPVFDGGPLYRIAVRLRYRVAGGAITWRLEPWRMDLAFRHAFEEAANRAQTDTGLPLVFGSPE